MAQIVRNACNAGDLGLSSGSGRSPGGMATNSVFFPEIHGQRRLASYESTEVTKGLDTTEPT